MERKNLALLCAGVLCFWLFALAFGSAQGAGLRAVKTEAPAQAAAADAPAAQTAAPADSLSLPCRAAVLIEPASGRVLYEKNADERVPIASITKLMTLLLTFEAVHGGKLTLDTPVPVSEHAYHMGGSQIWLEPGEQFTLDEMLRAICVSSANDAAVAVAELVGGSEPVFVEQMNARAAELGLQNTSFRNACGLDAEGHLSTARDVAALSCYILNTCPEILHYTGIWTDSLRNGQTQLVNTNKLLKRYSGITGLKTGTTGGAGVCISASATRDGLTLIAVILGAPSSAERFQAATALLDYGFAAYAAVPVPQLPAGADRKGKHGTDGAAGLQRPAPDRAAGKGGRGRPAHRADPARNTGSARGAGADGGHGRSLCGRNTAGRGRGEVCCGCAAADLWRRNGAAVAEPAGRMKRKRNTTAPKSGSLRQIGFGGAEQKMSGRPKEHY